MGKNGSGGRPEEGCLAEIDDPGGIKRELYGRRVGRPLRQRAQDLLRERLPLLRVPIPAFGHLNPADLFQPPVREVWLEIGAGNGAHAAWQAKHNPDIGLIAVEPFQNGVASLLVAMEDGDLRNVRILDDDARPLLAVLQPGSIQRCFILFPDPWPKRRHWRRRIVSAGVLDRLADLMPPGAELRIATDDVRYLVWILRVARAHPAFDWRPASADDWRCRPADMLETRFEEKGRLAGRPSTYLSLRRVAG